MAKRPHDSESLSRPSKKAKNTKNDSPATAKRSHDGEISAGQPSKKVKVAKDPAAAFERPQAGGKSAGQLSRKLKKTENSSRPEGSAPKATVTPIKFPLNFTSNVAAGGRKSESQAARSRGAENGQKGGEKEKPAEPRKSILVADEVDFPRGGGTTLTAHEVREARAEAAEEAREELLQERATKKKRSSIKGDAKGKTGSKEAPGTRVEHLNYKRLQVGTRLLCRISAIHPLHLVLTLPNHLAGYVLLTSITSQLTASLEREAERDSPSVQDDSDEEMELDDRPPELASIFRVGQYVQASVVTVRSAGSRDNGGVDLGRPRNDLEAMSRRVELSLVPEVVNEGVVARDIGPGFLLSGAVKSVEDHGYEVDLGIAKFSGFLPFSNSVGGEDGQRLQVGHLLLCSVASVSENRRVCTLSTKVETGKDIVSEVSTVASVLPGMLVRGLVMETSASGLVLQILGFFKGTIDVDHVPKDPSQYKVGSKVKARIIWDMPSSSPPQFALSALPHIVSLSSPRTIGEGSVDVEEKYTFGMIVDHVKVVRVDDDWGVTCAFEDGTQAFIHISHLADDHTPALSRTSGPWKIGSVNRGRVIGFHGLDGHLQLSFKPSILERKYLQTGEFQPGQILKGTIQRLTDVGLFIDVGGNISGRVVPVHYADIVLKHPEKRFRPGSSVKCRVLEVDPAHNRLSLTLKKSLLSSELPILASLEDAKPDIIVDSVVFKFLPHGALVGFYGGLKGFLPVREASDTFVKSCEDVFSIGQTIKVKILSVSPEDGHVLASAKQAMPTSKPSPASLDAITVGDTVEGIIQEVQIVNVLLALQPGGQIALASLANLAHRRQQSVEDLKSSLGVGAVLSDLVVVSKNPEKRLVIVAHRTPGATPILSVNGGVSYKNLRVGQILPGRVVGEHGSSGVSVRLSHHIIGRLHPIDLTDNLDDGINLPAMESLVKVAVAAFNPSARTVDLSTRPSRLKPDANAPIVDREVNSIGDIKIGQNIRGIVKNITDYGLYIALGRSVTARVQIKELFDDYVKDWKPRFALNQVVEGKIIQVDAPSGRIEMSLRSGAKVATEADPTLTPFHEFSESQKVEGKVTGIAEFGIFIRIDGSNVSGLCHRTELSDNKEGDLQAALQGFRIGDAVKAIILSIDTDKRKVSFGLKPSYFTTEDYEMDEVPNHDSGELEEDALEQDDSAAIEAQLEDELDEDMEEDEHVWDEEEESDEDIIILNGNPASALPKTASKPTTQPMQTVPALELSEGFEWSNTVEGEDEDDDDLDADGEAPDSNAESKAKKKKRKKPQIAEDFTLEMQQRPPESVADFERLLLGSPNSSFLWIQFMSFYLQLSELEKAREVARRALQIINFREEQEKLNVWIALLNLENTAGTEESLESVFNEAVKANDAKTMHLRMAAIFDESEKPEKAEDAYKKTVKKFGQSSKVWTLFGRHYMKLGKLEEARDLLPRSLKSLEKRKHIKTILKFAQMEYELGDAERGKTLLEAIVDSHPKRLDIWFIYDDMEAKYGDLQAARKLFDRMLSLKLNTHKAKSVFKKWLELEKRLGDETSQNHVKARAVEWTQQNS